MTTAIDFVKRIIEIRGRFETLPRVRLALLPTPLHEAPRLAEAIGVGRLYIKRDDLTGLAFGGNKTRNLEFRMADAVERGADVFIAGLEVHSNSARQVTAAANMLGMSPILVLRTDGPVEWQGNVLIDRVLGAEIRFVETADKTVVDRTLNEIAEEQRALGKKPYVMNHNPSFAIGSALAYVLCALEIVEQSMEAGIDPTHLYLASGNKGHAGLLLAKDLLGARFQPIAISQHYASDRVSGALDGARAAATALGYETRLTESDVESYDDFIDTRYGAASERGLAAISLAARTEGLLLDPIYTGKAMAGLIEHAREGKVGPESTVVFVHTGGQPALFSFAGALMEAFPQVAGGHV